MVEAMKTNLVRSNEQRKADAVAEPDRREAGGPMLPAEIVPGAQVNTMRSKSRMRVNHVNCTRVNSSGP